MIAVWLLLIIVFLVWLFFYLPAWRDRRIRNKPFPETWRSILGKSLPIYASLTLEEQVRLQQLIKLFIAKKRFVGCAGLEITDEIKVTIAAEACLLLLHHSWSVYPKLYSILVYPTTFVAHREEPQADGTVSLASRGLLGESWSNGRVILSWDNVVSGVANFSDGQNVVLHEFAHQLDSESGATNGAPILRRNSYGAWATVLSEEFEALKWDSMHHHKNTMDEYGATNPAEFFAVATETFFEKPQQLYKKHRKLFEELRLYYQTDPLLWHKDK